MEDEKVHFFPGAKPGATMIQLLQQVRLADEQIRLMTGVRSTVLDGHLPEKQIPPQKAT